MSFESDVVTIALKELFNGRHFSICDVDKIGEMIGTNPSKHPGYKYLRALHCVDYSKMTDEVREQLPNRVMDCLRPDSMNFEAMAMALTAEGRDATPIEDSYIDNGRVARLAWRN